MTTVMRAFLPALALMSLLVFCNPVSADMVPTPKPAAATDTVREMALAALKAEAAEAAPGMPELSKALEQMPTSDLLALQAASESTTRAGHHHSHRWFWWTFGIFITLFWLAVDHHSFHNHCD